jgi:diphosphomevalonate decarboxylase
VLPDHCHASLASNVLTRLQLSTFPLRICSENNFPTAAGLASSASGFAALVSSVSTLFELSSSVSVSELSRIARQGSGSACRSLFGGFVAWQGGEAADGSDSLAVEVAPREHWPELQALICVVSDAKKGTPSTAGMQRSVATSPLLAARIANVVPQRMDTMRKAIAARDFESFADATMQDSNNFHACCLDTSPPIFYMNDVSRAIVALVEELNRASRAAGSGAVAAYTYDAGPNAVLYAPKQNVPLILQLVRHYFPNADFDDTVSGAGRLPRRRLAADHPAFPSSTSSAPAPTRRTAAHKKHSRCPRPCRRASTPPSFPCTRRAPCAA